MTKDDEVNTERLIGAMSLSNLAERLKAEAIMIGPSIPLDGKNDTPKPDKASAEQTEQ